MIASTGPCNHCCEWRHIVVACPNRRSCWTCGNPGQSSLRMVPKKGRQKGDGTSHQPHHSMSKGQSNYGKGSGKSGGQGWSNGKGRRACATMTNQTAGQVWTVPCLSSAQDNLTDSLDISSAQQQSSQQPHTGDQIMVNREDFFEHRHGWHGSAGLKLGRHSLHVLPRNGAGHPKCSRYFVEVQKSDLHQRWTHVHIVNTCRCSGSGAKGSRILNFVDIL